MAIRQVSFFSHINPKSFDIELNIDFTDKIRVEVLPTDNTIVPLKYKLVLNSLNPSPKTRTVIFHDDSLLETGKSYKVTLYNGNIVFLQGNLTVPEFPAIINADVKTYGTRIIDITFPYPVRNLLKYSTAKGHGDGITPNLNNFYAMFYNRDEIGYPKSSTEGEPINLKGYFTVDELEQIYVASVSDDERTLSIQSNIRNLPIGDNHSLTINYSRLQGYNSLDTNLTLTDFSAEQHEIPILEKPFSITSEQFRAKPIKMIAKSLTELIVEFDKPVLIRKADVFRYNANPKSSTDGTSIGFVYADGAQLKISNRERINLNKNIIKYTLDSETPLPIGSSIMVNITPITDASGFITENISLPVKVVSKPPTVDKVYQDTDSITHDLTKIIVEYTWNMDIYSATNIANYTLRRISPSPSEITILDVTNFSNPTNKFILTTTSLPTGSYELCISNVKDFFNVNIQAPVYQNFNVVDLTVPTINKILVTEENKDVAIIMFDDIMSTTGEHGANKTLNYRLVENGTSSQPTAPILLNTNASIDSLKDSRWMRLNLVSPFPNPKVSISKIDVGYPRITDILYVTNHSGNILPICKDNFVDAIVPRIDVSKGSMRILTDSSLTFTTESENFMFDPMTLSHKDFTFSKPGFTSITATNATISDDYRTITFLFKEDTFDSSTSQITLEVIGAPKTTDIFGKLIIGNKSLEDNNITNMLSATIVSASKISFVDYSQPQMLKVALLFTEGISMTDASDFKVSSKLNVPIYIKGNSITKTYPGFDIFNKKIIELLLYSYGNIDLLNDELFISTSKPQESLTTFDSKGKKITPFSMVPINRLNVAKFHWSSNGNTSLSESTFTITFDKDVDLPTIGLNNTTYKTPLTTSTTIVETGSIPEVVSTIPLVVNGTNYGNIKIVSSNHLFAPNSTVQFALQFTSLNTIVITFIDAGTYLTNAYSSIRYAQYISNYSIIDTSKIFVNNIASPNDSPL